MTNNTYSTHSVQQIENRKKEDVEEKTLMQ